MFGLDHWRQDRDDYHILVDLPLLEKLAAQWQGQTQRLPDANELDALVEGYVREEILVREARRLSLHEDDVIIRRRLAQKYEFFLADADMPTEPDADALGAFFEANRARYRLPETFSFNHVFFDNESEARAAIAQLNADETDWRSLGLPFMLNRSYRTVTAERLAVDMGDAFVAHCARLPKRAGRGRLLRRLARTRLNWRSIMLVAMLRLTMLPRAWFAIGKCTSRRRRATQG